MDRKNLFIVTGATGFIGLHLVPRLEEDGELLLVSRDPIEAARRFPDAQVCGYDDLPRRDLTGATFIHLAVRNNDRPGTAEDFNRTNVDFLLEVAAIAKDRGAIRFVNLCSTHAIDPDRRDLYGRSKRNGASRLRTFWPHGAINLYVPAVYGTTFGGRLSFINRLPLFARSATLALLRLVKPVLSVDYLGKALTELPADRSEDSYRTEIYLADPTPVLGLYVGIKRAIDLLVALSVIIFGGWAMVLIALYIRFDSKGPAVFAQQRVGKHGTVFTCYKFRTMATGTADVATHDVSISSVTKAGRILRKTKLDELPQVANVLRNEMSLVGPRPCLPVQQELIERRAARAVLTLKPGITGLAQIKDVDMSDPARLAALDDRYRAFRTVVGDGIILVRTVLGGGSGDRVRVKDHG
jgi:lipopolysaccharide/colanic/teichoic acid biosynthesis glycosyltransferase